MARHQHDGSKERFWRRTIGEWQRSGQSVRAFCAAQGLAEPSFYAWRRTLTERSPLADPPAFVPVRVAASASLLEVVLGSGRVVRVPAGFDAITLRQLLAVLEEGPSC